MKRKGTTPGTERRRSARLQAKAPLDFRPMFSNSSRTNSDLVSAESLNSPLSKRFKKTETSSDLENSDRNSSSKSPAEFFSTVDRCIGWVTPQAEAGFPTAPCRYGQSNAINGDKTKECNNTRLAETFTETNSPFEGTFSTPNVNTEIVAHSGGDKSEECNDTRPAGTSIETNAPAEGTSNMGNVKSTIVAQSDFVTATNASRTPSGGQVALEEVRDIPADVVKRMSKDISNPKTTNESQRPTYSTDFSGWASVFADENFDEEEVQSDCVSAMESVQGYKVKEPFAPILRNVMERYGDIAMNCNVETLGNRSFFLEKVCELLQTLQTTKFVDISGNVIKGMLELVSAFQSLNLDISWLRKRLEEILEVKELMSRASQFKETRKRNLQIIQESKQALNSCETKILIYKSQIQATEETASLEKEKIAMAQAENKSIAQKVSDLKPKMERFIKESMLNDLI